MVPAGRVGPAVVGARLGEEQEVAGRECEVERDASALSASDSRTWRITSASRRTSVSMGAPSSRRAALMRAKFLDLGCKQWVRNGLRDVGGFGGGVIP